jgi:hypothetical protein
MLKVTYSTLQSQLLHPGFTKTFFLLKEYSKHMNSLEALGVIVIRREHIKVCGTLAVALLLSRIIFWHEQSTSGDIQVSVFRNGFSWIAKNQEQWAADTGLTSNQYRRAVRVLKEKNIIDVKVMKLGGNPTTHLRLLPENLEKAVFEAGEQTW